MTILPIAGRALTIPAFVCRDAAVVVDDGVDGVGDDDALSRVAVSAVLLSFVPWVAPPGSVVGFISGNSIVSAAILAVCGRITC
jgi:hypothetical protein